MYRSSCCSWRLYILIYRSAKLQALYSYSCYPVHVYAQQGSTFGHVGLCMYACGQKIDLFSALLFEKLLPCVLYYLILEFKHLQSGFLRPASCTSGAFRSCSI